MAIRVTVSGVTAECDTAAEAAEFCKSMAGDTPRMPARDEGAANQNGTPVPEHGFASLWAQLDERQKEFLTLIARSPEPIEATALAEQLAIEIGPLGWTRRKITTLASAQNIDLNRYFTVKKLVRPGDQRIRTVYKATPRLIAAIPRHG